MDLEQLLASVPLTAGLEERVRRRLAGIGRVRAYPGGTTIVEEGATGTALEIRGGAVTVSRSLQDGRART